MVSFELEESRVSWLFFTTSVVGHGLEHDENVILSWENVFSSVLTHTDVSMFKRIVGLTPVIVIIELSWWLHVNIYIFIEACLLNFKINPSISRRC